MTTKLALMAAAAVTAALSFTSTPAQALTADPACSQGSVCLYTDTGYAGARFSEVGPPVGEKVSTSACAAIRADDFRTVEAWYWSDFWDVARDVMLNDQASSIVNNTGCVISLYTDTRQAGAVLNVLSGQRIPDLRAVMRTDPSTSAYPFNDSLSSMLGYAPTQPTCPANTLCVAVHPNMLTDATHAWNDPSLYTQIPADSKYRSGNGWVVPDLRTLPRGSTGATWNDAIGSATIGQGGVQWTLWANVKPAGMRFEDLFKHVANGERAALPPVAPQWQNLQSIVLASYRDGVFTFDATAVTNLSYQVSAVAAD